MTHRHTLKDRDFRVIGYVETDGCGKQTLKDKNFRVLGYYDPHDDVTKDRDFRRIGSGNLLGTLL